MHPPFLFVCLRKKCNTYLLFLPLLKVFYTKLGIIGNNINTDEKTTENRKEFLIGFSLKKETENHVKSWAKKLLQLIFVSIAAPRLKVLGKWEVEWISGLKDPCRKMYVELCFHWAGIMSKVLFVCSSCDNGSEIVRK